MVHGAWHRGSSWAPVVAQLERTGMPASAPDLPADTPGTGHEDLMAPVLAAAGADGPVVLAGHSLGGLVAAAVAGRLDPARVRALVLVGALVPEPGRAYRDRMRAEPELMVPGYDAGVRRGEGRITYWPDAETAATGLYRGVAEEPAGGGRAAVAAAVADLRPQDWTLLAEPCPLTTWPTVRTVSVICTGDRVVDPDGSRREAARIGAEVVELGGGHFPMCTRPGELAGLLAGVAAAPG
nr:alpha/beta hydrolase [Pseudonocardia sp. C8]